MTRADFDEFESVQQYWIAETINLIAGVILISVGGVGVFTSVALESHVLAVFSIALILLGVFHGCAASDVRYTRRIYDFFFGPGIWTKKPESGDER